MTIQNQLCCTINSFLWPLEKLEKKFFRVKTLKHTFWPCPIWKYFLNFIQGDICVLSCLILLLPCELTFKFHLQEENPSLKSCGGGSSVSAKHWWIPVALGTRAPDPISYISVQFLAKIMQNNRIPSKLRVGHCNLFKSNCLCISFLSLALQKTWYSPLFGTEKITVVLCNFLK